MIRRSRLLLLMLAVTLALALAGVPGVSASSGLICGTPDDPIPCSTFNQGRCTYTYNAASNCCVGRTHGCIQYCC